MEAKNIKNKPINHRKGLRIVKKANKESIDRTELNNTGNFDHNENIITNNNDSVKEIYKKVKIPYHKYKFGFFEYMFIRLTPEKYLDKIDLEFYKELVLASFTKKENIQYKNFNLVHDSNNSFDDFAVEVIYDKFSLGLIRKNIDFNNYSDIINTFIFDQNYEIKKNLTIMIWEGKFILINKIEN